MSFILEALRKSEAARRRSEAPDLFSTMHDAPAPARERRNAPVWIVGVVGVLSLGIATWLVLQRPSAPETSAPVASVPGNAMIDTPLVTQAAPEAADVAAPATTQPATPAPATPPPPSVTPSPTSSPAPIATAPAATPPPASLPEPPPAPRPPVSHPPVSRSDRPMALSELDAGSRRQLPALKMSMHMWNEDTGRRFVILDGQRLGEGDLIGDAQVESITRDGVILNWQGARLHIGTR